MQVELAISKHVKSRKVEVENESPKDAQASSFKKCYLDGGRKPLAVNRKWVHSKLQDALSQLTQNYYDTRNWSNYRRYIHMALFHLVVMTIALATVIQTSLNSKM